jgi:Flp pilus assembly pilin Flp
MTRPACKPLAAAIVRDERGVSAIEFALIAPALLMILLGLMDLSYNIYATSVLEGAMQAAGRDATLEGAEGRGLAIDDRVRDVVDDVVSNGDLQFSRRSYVDYSSVARPEDFTDVDADGLCDNGEPFEDANGNGTWDDDRGRADMGGARDAVLYTATLSYPRAFPLMGLLGFDNTVTARARTVLRNQPYGLQNKAVAVANCT